MSIQETYAKRLEEQKKSILGSKIAEQLEIKMFSNDKLDSLYKEMSSVTGKPVYEDFNFRSGKILGVLRHIFQNPKQRKELCEVTGLNTAVIDMYYQVCGNLPYLNTKTNTINAGRPMDCEATRDLIKYVASELNILIDDNDLLDINEERWERLSKNALEDAKATMEFNEKNKTVAYEE